MTADDRLLIAEALEAAARVLRGEASLDLPRHGLALDDEDATMTAADAAEMLGVSIDLIYDSVRNGILPARRLGRRLVISRRALHTWLEQTGGASR